MGKSLDLALKDFDRRFGRESRRQAALHRAPFKKFVRSRSYLHRCFKTSQSTARKLIDLKVDVRLNRSEKDASAQGFLAIGLWNKRTDDVVLLEMTSVSPSTPCVVFKSLPSSINDRRTIEQLERNDIDLVLQIWLDREEADKPSQSSSSSSNRKASSKKTAQFRSASRKTWSLMINGNLREWERQKHQTLSALTQFSHRSTLMTAVVLLSRSGSDSGRTILVVDPRTNLEFASLRVETMMNRSLCKVRSRRECVLSENSLFSQALRLSSLETASEVEFHFPFGEGLALRRVQRAKEGRCIFCNRLHSTPESLVVHLAMDHIFKDWEFEFDVDSGILIVRVLNWAVPVPAASMLPKPRRYVHSDTCEALTPQEIDEDSEDEIDEHWLHERTEMLLDQFEDVDEGEVTLMKYWNRHVRYYSKTRTVTDLCMTDMCESFVKNNLASLAKLRRELLLHFFNLWDLGLLTKDSIASCLGYFD